MNTKLIAAISLALAMAACASAPQPNVALENARSAVRAAEADPNVATYAALDIHTARTELDGLAIGEHVNPFGGRRLESPVQGVE